MGREFSQDFSSTKSGYISYHKFADLVGYDKPLKSNKAAARRNFFKIILKDIGSNMQQLAMELRSQDQEITGAIGINNFFNVIQSFSQKLSQIPDTIKIVGHDFAVDGAPNLVDYQRFMNRVSQERVNVETTHKMFKTFYEYTGFMEQSDLYACIFAPFDNAKTRSFTVLQLTTIFENVLGMQGETASHDASMLASYLSGRQSTGPQDIVKFESLDTEYREHVAAETKVGRLTRPTSLMTILKIIKAYVDTTGQTLRQVFEKTKPGEGDQIN